MTTRCAWADNDPQMAAYHDGEWGVPQHDGRMLWEMLMLEGFQAGLAWIVILRKREGFRAAFADFAPEIVARFGDEDRARLMADAGIIRSNAKIDAAINGARIYLDMRERGEDLGQMLWGMVGGAPVQSESVPHTTWSAPMPAIIMPIMYAATRGSAMLLWAKIWPRSAYTLLTPNCEGM